MIQNPLSHHRRDFDKLFMSPFSVTHERTRSLSQQAISPNAAANQMPGKPSWEQKLLFKHPQFQDCLKIKLES